MDNAENTHGDADDPVAGGRAVRHGILNITGKPVGGTGCIGDGRV